MKDLLRFILISLPMLFFSSKTYAQSNITALAPSSFSANSTQLFDNRANFSGLSPMHIPIYLINNGKLHHQIALNYLSQGFKVEDEASWVGLGFTLVVGGSITRVVRGLPDEKTGGFFNGAPTASSVYASPSLLQNAVDTQIDTHPDIFNYDFDGYSGKIIFDRTGQPSLVPKRNFIVTKSADMSSITIVSENGTTYVFDVKETGKVNNAGYHASLTTPYTTAWNLSSIKSSDNVNTITFVYNPTPVTSTKTLFGSTLLFKNYNNGIYDKTTTQQITYDVQYSTPVLQSITFNNGSLVFNTASRTDSPFPRLTSIDLKYLSGAAARSFTFDMDYFRVKSSDSNPDVLKLKLVKFWPTTDGAYSFDYAPQYNRVSNPNLQKSQDHWGFFNGRNQTSRIPQHVKFFSSDPNADIGLNDYALTQGENMSSNLDATQMFMLKKMTNPAGGKVLYDYELNEADYTVETPSVTRYGPVIISGSDRTTKNFTVPSTTVSWRGAAAVMTITSDCGAIEDTQCGEDQPIAIISGCPYIQIIGPTGKSWGCKYTNRVFEFFLKPGNYQLKVTGGTSFTASLVYYAIDPSYLAQNKRVGGLRIVRTTTYASDRDTKPMIKRYLYNDDAGKTTGKLNADLRYNYEYHKIDKTEKRGEIEFPSQPLCYVKRMWATSNPSKVSNGLAQDYTVGYSRIVELDGETGQNGKTEYHFFSSDDYSSNNLLTSNSWKRGHLQKKIIYRRAGAEYKKVSEVINEYDFDSYPNNLAKEISGFSVGVSSTEQDGCTFQGTRSKFSIFEYKINSDWYFVKKTTTTSYDDAEQPMSKSAEVSYDYVNLMPVKQISETSESDKTLVTLTNFTGNYADASGTFISDLKAAHIMTAPIEQTVFTEKTLAGGSKEIKIVSGKVMTYKRGDNVGSNLVARPDISYDLLLPNGDPIALGSFAFTNAAVGNLPNYDSPGSFVFPSAQYVANATIEATDTQGKPTKIMGSDGIRTTMLWGNRGENLVAKSTNANLINFTSFEVTSEKGGWSFAGTPVLENGTAKAKSGKYYYNLGNGNITSSTLENSVVYRLSFWAKGGTPTLTNATGGNGTSGVVDVDGWKYYSRQISNTTLLTISGASGIFVEDITLTEAVALSETYVYDDLNGPLAKTDVNGKMVYNQYDNAGRIAFIRNEKKSILKSYTYNLTKKNVSGSITAQFSVSGTMQQGKLLTFTATGGPANAQYDWDFGDGTIVTNGNSQISRPYANAGSYVVTLTVINGANYNIAQQSVDLRPADVIKPNWAPPSLQIERRFVGSYPNISSVLRITATAQVGGVAPIQRYYWSTSLDGAPADSWIVRMDGQDSSPTIDITTGLSGTIYIHCRIMDAIGEYSQEAIVMKNTLE